MQLPPSIAELVRNLEAQEAYRLISELGDGGATIYVNRHSFKLADVLTDPAIFDNKAKDVGPFLFWGGPPRKLKYYDGTLHTLLCDRILDAIVNKGCRYVYNKITNPLRDDYPRRSGVGIARA